jgi:uncharacterized protein (DUF1778 family)
MRWRLALLVAGPSLIVAYNARVNAAEGRVRGLAVTVRELREENAQLLAACREARMILLHNRLSSLTTEQRRAAIERLNTLCREHPAGRDAVDAAR